VRLSVSLSPLSRDGGHSIFSTAIVTAAAAAAVAATPGQRSFLVHFFFVVVVFILFNEHGISFFSFGAVVFLVDERSDAVGPGRDALAILLPRGGQAGGSDTSAWLGCGHFYIGGGRGCMSIAV